MFFAYLKGTKVMVKDKYVTDEGYVFLGMDNNINNLNKKVKKVMMAIHRRRGKVCSSM